jgi:hypothetical protein
VLKLLNPFESHKKDAQAGKELIWNKKESKGRMESNWQNKAGFYFSKAIQSGNETRIREAAGTLDCTWQRKPFLLLSSQWKVPFLM